MPRSCGKVVHFLRFRFRKQKQGGQLFQNLIGNGSAVLFNVTDIHGGVVQFNGKLPCGHFPFHTLCDQKVPEGLCSVHVAAPFAVRSFANTVSILYPELFTNTRGFGKVKTRWAFLHPSHFPNSGTAYVCKAFLSISPYCKTTSSGAVIRISPLN